MVLDLGIDRIHRGDGRRVGFHAGRLGRHDRRAGHARDLGLQLGDPVAQLVKLASARLVTKAIAASPERATSASSVVV